MQISKWGNSLGLRLPAGLVKALGLKPGVECEVVATGHAGFSVKVLDESGDEMAKRIKSLRRFRGAMPEGYRFNRDEAHER